MTMAVTIVDLLPWPLATWVRARAALEGTTPDALIVTLLQGAQALIAYADRDRGLPPVAVNMPPPPIVALPPRRERPTMAEALRCAVVTLGEATAATASAEVRRVLGYPYLPPRTAATLLSALTQRGELRRLRPGVYGPPSSPTR
jgi:hypothetical protein